MAGLDELCAIANLSARLAVDGVPENIEHSREDLFADRRFHRPPGVFHGCAAGEALGGVSAIPRTQCASS